MKVVFSPSIAGGETAAPPSKSVGQRLLICAALAGGSSEIKNTGRSDDISAVISCLRALGAEIVLKDGTAVVRGIGEDGARPPESRRTADCGSDNPAGKSGDEGRITADCGESGAALRFLIPVCLGLGKKTVFRGRAKLFSRPLGVYEEICRKQGLEFSLSADSLEVGGQLRPGEFNLSGNISSQFVSGLLFALPLLERDSRIKIIPPVESRPYIDMTIETLAEFGIRAFWENDLTIKVPGGQKYSGADVTNEGDWSGAAYLEGLNLTGGDVVISGLKADSLQGDRVYREYFAKIAEGRCVTELRSEPGLLPEIDISDCPDLGPVLMALGAANKGVRLTGTRRLKYKESDRASAMKEELSEFGAEVVVEEDRVAVCPGIRTPNKPLDGHGDHRVVMALSLLLAKTGGSIKGAEAVTKSFPDFFDKLESLGINLTREY